MRSSLPPESFGSLVPQLVYRPLTAEPFETPLQNCWFVSRPVHFQAPSVTASVPPSQAAPPAALTSVAIAVFSPLDMLDAMYAFDLPNDTASIVLWAFAHV